jgi:hypothetical protein
MKTRIFTVVEVFLILIALAIVASVLLPVFAPARTHGPQFYCNKNLRQLANAVEMYIQDNKGTYPGADWNTAIEQYVGIRSYFFCPSDVEFQKVDPVSYGFSGLLIRPDGTGVNEKQILAPSEVGTFVDCIPTNQWADGGAIIGGGAMRNPSPHRIVEPDPRHNGMLIAYCDGHTKVTIGASFNDKDISNNAGRAFYQAINLGLINNYAGGINQVAVAPTKATVVIGGDTAGMPLLRAAADVWAAKGGTWYTMGFLGQTPPQTKVGKAAKHYVWLDASGSGAGTPIAQDAFVFIVSNNCKIPVGDIGKDADTTLAELSGILCGPEKGYKADIFQAYTLGAKDGSRAYAQSATVLNGTIGKLAMTVKDDSDMVEHVAADPYGIGYCSAAAADTDKVTILGLDGKLYPNQNPKYRWLVLDTAAHAAGEFEYPLIRTLRLRTKGDGAVLAAMMADPEFLNGPLFKTGYYIP